MSIELPHTFASLKERMEIAEREFNEYAYEQWEHPKVGERYIETLTPRDDGTVTKMTHQQSFPPGTFVYITYGNGDRFKGKVLQPRRVDDGVQTVGTVWKKYSVIHGTFKDFRVHGECCSVPIADLHSDSRVFTLATYEEGELQGTVLRRQHTAEIIFVSFPYEMQGTLYYCDGCTAYKGTLPEFCQPTGQGVFLRLQSDGKWRIEYAGGWDGHHREGHGILVEQVDNTFITQCVKYDKDEIVERQPVSVAVGPIPDAWEIAFHTYHKALPDDGGSELATCECSRELVETTLITLRNELNVREAELALSSITYRSPWLSFAKIELESLSAQLHQPNLTDKQFVEAMRQLLRLPFYIGAKKPTPQEPFRFNDSEILYEGDLLDGVPHGQGKMYFSLAKDGHYEGTFVNGLMDGPGVEYPVEGAAFRGQWTSNKKNGPFEVRVAQLQRTFYCNFINNVLSTSNVKIYFDNGFRYHGEVANDNLTQHGRGLLFLPTNHEIETQPPHLKWLQRTFDLSSNTNNVTAAPTKVYHYDDNVTNSNFLYTIRGTWHRGVLKGPFEIHIIKENYVVRFEPTTSDETNPHTVASSSGCQGRLIFPDGAGSLKGILEIDSSASMIFYLSHHKQDGCTMLPSHSNLPPPFQLPPQPNEPLKCSNGHRMCCCFVFLDLNHCSEKCTDELHTAKWRYRCSECHYDLCSDCVSTKNTATN